MVKTLAVVALLAVAQIIPSCGDRPGSGDAPDGGGQAQVIGWVEEKRARAYDMFPHLIVINSIEYGVPYEFWMDVSVGDLVRFRGGVWTILRRARS